jgi:choline dehydrogenase-like flavoprotein
MNVSVECDAIVIGTGAGGGTLALHHTFSKLAFRWLDADRSAWKRSGAEGADHAWWK